MGPGTQRVHYANYTVIVIPPCETSESFHSENLILNGKWLKVWDFLSETSPRS